MLIRYFGAAKAAAGQEEEVLDAAGLTLGELLEKLAARTPASAGAPRLATVIARSSFLVNETAARDRSRVLGNDDVVDILPPFAGG